MTSEQPTATQVGYSFVSMYYTTLIQDPKSLYKFYKEESQLTHRTGLHDEEEKTVVSGLNEIRNKIDSIVYDDAKVKLTHVDSQSSMNGSVFVSVEGQISFTSNESLKRFTQAFLLVAQQPKGYYVNNDVFRFVSTGPIASQNEQWNTSQNLLHSPQRKQVIDSDNISEADSSNISVADSTIATIGASSVAGIEETMSQMMKDVDESKQSQHNLQNGDDEEEDEEQHVDEKHEDQPNKTYSSWSQVVGGDEYAAPIPPPEKKQRPRNKPKPSTSSEELPEQQFGTFHKQDSFHRKSDSFTRNKTDKPAVYVSKLQQEVSDQDLMEAFTPFGTVAQIVNRTQSTGGVVGGYALVFYNSSEEVEKAIQQKGKIQVKGAIVSVDKHVRKTTPYPYSARGRGGAERGGSDRGRGGRGGRGRGDWSGSSPRGNDRGRGRGGFGSGRGKPNTVPTTNNENNTNNTQQ